jgi:hypothetical protein
MATITATYVTSSSWDIEEICKDLEITLEQVKDYYVKWDKLFLTYIDADGEECEEEFEPNDFSASENFDWKRPTETQDDFLEEVA